MLARRAHLEIPTSNGNGAIPRWRRPRPGRRDPFEAEGKEESVQSVCDSIEQNDDARAPVSSLVARSAATAAALIAFLVTVVGGAATPHYTHGTNYISELGARGEIHGELVSLGGFLPVGLAALLALAMSLRLEANRAFKAAIFWMLTLPLAYITAAFARCAPGCAGLDGAQAIHNMAGMAEYLGGTIALAVAGSAMIKSRRLGLGAVLWLLAIVVFICLNALASPQFALRGAAQRLAEVVLFGFLLFLAWHPAQRRSLVRN